MKFVSAKILAENSSFNLYKFCPHLWAEAAQEAGLKAMSRIGPGGDTYMITVGAGGEEVFTCGLAGTEVVGWENVEVLVVLLEAVRDEALALH